MNRRVVGLLSCVFVTSAVAACGGGAPALSPDAGVDAGFVIAEPAPPLAPVLTPCAAGWREATDPAGVVTCDPWPATGYRTDCAWDEAHFAGTPGCARVGTACPADGWPAELPTDRTIVYVDDDAAPGGDGTSRASAFGVIGDAVAAAPSGAVIAVATGSYDEAVRVGAGMTLWGACVSGTRVVTSTPSATGGALTFTAAGGGARNLGIDGPERPGIVALGVSGIVIESVVVTRARVYGLYLNGGSMVASDVVVRGSREQASDGAGGRGINVQGGAHLVLSRALMDDNRDTGAILFGAGTNVEATDLVVRGTRQQASDGSLGRGITVHSGARFVLSRALIDANLEIGVFVASVGTSVEASDLVVRGTREQVADGLGGRGIAIQGGAQVVLSRALIDDDRESGIIAFGAGTSVEASDLVVRGIREEASDGRRGHGMNVSEGAHAVLSRALMDDNRDSGLIVLGAGTSVEANDLEVRGTREAALDGSAGRGIDVESGAQLALSRALLDDNREGGLAVGGAETSVVASDLVVRGTRAQASDGSYGRGITVQSGARLAVSRTLVDDNRESGIYVGGAGTSMEASDLVVRDTLPQSLDGTLGVGMWAQANARVVITGARIEGSHFVGIGSVTGASTELRDVVVSGVEASACIPGVCAGEMGGFGLVAMFGGVLIATRFTVDDASLCAVLVGRNSDVATGLDLTGGVVDRSAVGACVQLDGYDTTRLQSGVEYRDVGVPLRATSYELPASL
jgi:hypothetical protein